MKNFHSQPGCRKGLLVFSIEIEVQIDQITRFYLCSKFFQAANQPEPNTIVEGAVNECMKSITGNILRAEGTVGAGHLVAENSMEAILGWQKVVQKAKDKAVVCGVKTRKNADFPYLFPVEVGVLNFCF